MKGIQIIRIRNYSKIQMPELKFSPKKYDGYSFEKLKNIRKTKLFPGLAQYYNSPLALHQGYKQWLFDINGKRYLDMYGGICTVSVGHCHPKVVNAVIDQMKTLGHVSYIYYYSKLQEYAERLTDKLPGELKVVYFVNSGSEATDLAILLARLYTNKYDVISLRNCYHGFTYQAMCLSSMSCFKFAVPQNGGFLKTINPDVYRGIWGGSNCRNSPIKTGGNPCTCNENICQAGENYLNAFKTELLSECRTNLAGMFVESIQGAGGCVQFPKNYVKGVYDIVKENDALFISDEVQTGFGRTGDHFWGFEMHEIIPDIVTMAKGIGNGFPLGAVVTTPEIASAFNKGTHFNTYSGNPLACAAGMAVLDVIEEEKLQLNSKTVGTYLLRKLSELKSENIGDVRGKGLMIGIELVEDKISKAPLQTAKFSEMMEYCRNEGLLIGKGGIHGNVIRIKPPMCVTKNDADFTIQVIQNALNTI